MKYVLKTLFVDIKDVYSQLSGVRIYVDIPFVCINLKRDLLLLECTIFENNVKFLWSRIIYSCGHDIVIKLSLFYKNIMIYQLNIEFLHVHTKLFFATLAQFSVLMMSLDS